MGSPQSAGRLRSEKDARSGRSQTRPCSSSIERLQWTRDKQRTLTQAQDEYERQREADSQDLDEDKCGEIHALATDFPRLWNDPRTPLREKKRIVRLLIEDVTLLIVIHSDDVGMYGIFQRGGSRILLFDSSGESELMETEYPGASLPTSEIPASIRYRDRHFFELGSGGVDFPAIHQILTDADWSGWFTVELDSTITTSMGSATVSREYLERVLGLDPTQPGQRPSWTA